MEMFALAAQNARFSSFNPRPEKHGEDNVPASDLQFQTIVPGVMLNLFENKFREAFYRKMGKDETAGDLADQAEAPADGLVKLKFTQMGDIPWKRDYPGYKLNIRHGIEGGVLVELGECTMRGIKFSPKDGGSVGIQFSLAAKPTEEQAGKIYGLMGDEVVIDLIPPTATDEVQGDLTK